MKNRTISLLLFLLGAISVLLIAAVPEWIQYNERVVGENSPLYDDVVNRPAKQIWLNFTSQHTTDGAHKSLLFLPTPIATVTPSAGDLYFLVEHSATGLHSYPTPIPTLAPVATVTPSAGDVYFTAEHTVLGIHTPFPTPIPTLAPVATVTPSEGDTYFTVEHTVLGIHTPFPTPIPTPTPNTFVIALSNQGGFSSSIYNPGLPFGRADSWAVYNTTTVNANSKGFTGAVFDGRYVYFVPTNNGSAFGQVTRYDTTGNFTTAGSWAVYDTTTVNANSKGFYGGVFDGRYLYLCPMNNGAIFGQVTRYDTTGNFTTAGSWAVYDTTAVNANSKGFAGGVFDGRYVYFIPGQAASGQVTRYDTTGNFTTAGSWAVYDTTAVNANSKGFIGGVFDGRYVYLVPQNNGAFYGQVTRYDTTGSFTTAGSWAVYDTTAVNANSKGFYGGVFDGRYVYFIPYYTGSVVSGQVTRYDTTQSFTTAGSWTVYDTTAVNANSKGFMGGILDGRYLYMIPNVVGSPHGQVTRFDTGRLLK